MEKAQAFPQKKQDLRHCGVPEVLHYGVMFNFLRYCGLDPQSHSLHVIKKVAFTLAEVLITLGIIGVVAAMTLPALIGNYQKQVTVNKLKRSYTTISQMFTRARSDYGDPNEWSFSYGAMNNSDGTSNFSVVLPEVAKTYFLPYLDVTMTAVQPVRKFQNHINI